MEAREEREGRERNEKGSIHRPLYTFSPLVYVFAITVLKSVMEAIAESIAEAIVQIIATIFVGLIGGFIAAIVSILTGKNIRMPVVPTTHGTRRGAQRKTSGTVVPRELINNM